MITTVIPYQQATLFYTAAAAPDKTRAVLGVPESAPGKADSIALSAVARARLAGDGARATIAAKTADTDNPAAALQDAAKTTMERLKRSQTREFTARGTEITNPDTSGHGRAIASVRTIAPQPVRIADLYA